MPDLTITPLARGDIKDIGRYTQTTWGMAQRDAYLRAFTAVFEQMRDGTISGRARGEIRENLLCYPCNKHMVFFRRTGGGDVQILRVLHERMDFGQHL
ncbi:type II toxin-antitoxin system RelE/ParE family toxin [Thalassobius sp. I31.1]|uniref:type II toxin-antitoxin system RelE/ParE family toxin n=1 Tax=Thalassobius sp. I31.1 TaxID=2109912 RepID=UPI000D1ADAEA|nr:type II toxin-antitoxin system RelE/ParE family toxin [Thalassobius sp. I31.1]